MDWTPLDDGATLGTRGSEDGVIIRDDERPDGARVTFEKATLHAPLAITCGTYGCMMHTRFFGNAETANLEFDAMKLAMTGILMRLADQSENIASRVVVSDLVLGFVTKFP